MRSAGHVALLALVFAACDGGDVGEAQCDDPHVHYAPDPAGDLYFGCSPPAGWGTTPPDDPAPTVPTASDTDTDTDTDADTDADTDVDADTDSDVVPPVDTAQPPSGDTAVEEDAPDTGLGEADPEDTGAVDDTGLLEDTGAVDDTGLLAGPEDAGDEPPGPVDTSLPPPPDDTALP